MNAPFDEASLSCGLFDAHELFHSIRDQEKIAVAVSGGSDSLALLLMLAEWVNEQGKFLHCLTVDHALRATSLDEAVMVGRCCAKLGISHDILKWVGEKPTAGLSNAARDARYELMAERCLALGISDLVLGHQRDDQAETLLMRLSRSDQGGRGLAGMPSKTEYRTDANGQITLHRPLLGLSREDLQRFLSARAVNWVSDPTNDNDAYERVRTRSMLGNNEILSEQLLSYAKVSARYRSAMSLAVARFISTYVDRIRFGGLVLDKAALETLPEPIMVLVLQTLLSVIGGRDYLPSTADVQRMLQGIGGHTLARVRLHVEGSSVYLTREVRNLPGTEKLGNLAFSWDKRFVIKTSHFKAEVVSGSDLDADIVNDFVETVQSPLSKIEKIALQSSPFLIFQQHGKINAISCLEEGDSKLMSVWPLYGGFQRFCGAFDLPIRRALERLLTT